MVFSITKMTMTQPSLNPQPSVQTRWRIGVLALLMIGLFASVYYVWDRYSNAEYVEQPKRYGTTFSTKYANELGLDWQETYLAMLDDLQIDLVRVPVYWNEIEGERDAVYLDNIQWMMDEAAER